MKIRLLLIALVVAQLVSAQTPVDNHGQLSVDGKYIVDENSDPVQLTGMSLFWSNWGGKYYNYETIKWLRDDWKIKIIRAAMGVTGNSSGEGYLDSPEGRKAQLERIDTVVLSAEKLGIYVIVDWHSHHAHEELDSAKVFFANIAQTYGHLPNVIYEIYNEPEQVDWSTVVKPYLEAVIDTIRVYDADNIIMCGSPTWSQDVDEVAKDPILGDDNLVYSLHYYAASHKQYLRDKAVIAMDSGLAVFVNEFGTVDNFGQGSVDVESTQEWFEFLDSNKIGWCNWSAHDKAEPASALKPGASTSGGWALDDLTESGKLIYGKLLYDYYSENMDPDSKPMIFGQPQSTNAIDGQKVEFSVVALSPDTLEYQWYLYGEEISEATDSLLTISSFTAADTGLYHVVVTNSNGSTNSDTAFLGLMVREPYNGVIAIPGTLEAEDFDKGGNDFTYYDTDAENKGGEYRPTEEVDIEKSEESGGFQVGYVATGEWLEYTVNVANDDEYLLVLYVASMNGGGKMKVEFANGGNHTFDIPKTGSWSGRDIVYTTLNLTAGEQIAKISVSDGSNPKEYNIDKIEITVFDGEYPSATGDIDHNIYKLYPNPTEGMVTIENEGMTTVEVFNGVTRIDMFESEGTIQYSLEDYPTGMYIFRFSMNGKTSVVKVIKQ